MSVSAIAKLYAEKVKNGEKTIDDVPERWRELVREKIEDESENTESTDENR